VSLFFRITTDQKVLPVAWESACQGPFPTACWLIGGGPSLAALPCQDIARSPAPKLGLNLAGVRLIRPNFWTAYDPSIRFHKSLYLDAGIVKFLPRARAMDLVPETDFKVCECPQTCFFDRDPHRGYHDFLSVQPAGILDWADSLVQAIDIAYRLGFRRLYLAGCELCVRPSQEWITRAAQQGVSHVEGEPLPDFVQRCRNAGLSEDDMKRYGLGPQYHFDEAKPFEAAVRTDAHYFRVVQSLRLSRQALSSAGLRLISVTPRSRLNSFFEYQPAEEALDQIRQEVGDPAREPTRGLYTQSVDRRIGSLPPMRDLLPPHRPPAQKPCDCQQPRSHETAEPSAELVVEEEAWKPVKMA
jgi:hypothetical protein